MVEAYLDIETTGLSAEYCAITVVGILVVAHEREQVFQYVEDDITEDNITRALQGVRILHTYNGTRFDLPFIKRRLGLDLESAYEHCDVMHMCHQHRLYGGLKVVEKTLCITRRHTEVNGYQAVRLWWQYKNYYDTGALKTLLEYNLEDIANLRLVKQRLDRDSA
jgi:hypothetical protein